MFSLFIIPLPSSPRTLVFSWGKYSSFSEKMPSVWQLFIQARGLVRSGTELERNHSCVCAPGSYFEDTENLYRQYCVIPVGFGDFPPLLSSVGDRLYGLYHSEVETKGFSGSALRNFHRQ